MMAKYCLIRKTAGPDVTPPVISGVDSGTPGQMSAMITWMTDELADSQLQYGLTLSYGININQDTNPRVVSHSINLTGLTPGAFYYYRVRSADAAAKLALSAGIIVPGTVTNAGFAPTTTEFEASDITDAAPEHYKGRIVIFTGGTLLAQASKIEDYSLSSGRGHFTVTALTSAPANGVTFVIV
jgi:hypothetical protein